jgi:hypothetical protein
MCLRQLAIDHLTYVPGHAIFPLGMGDGRGQVADDPRFHADVSG